MPRYSNQIFVHTVQDAMLVPNGTYSTILTESFSVTAGTIFVKTFVRLYTESITLTDVATQMKVFLRTLSDSIFLTDTFKNSFSLKVLTEAITLALTFSPKKNGTNVIWTHIVKSASSTWTKVTKHASTWTHTNKSNQ